jgi:hypothetical protein
MAPIALALLALASLAPALDNPAGAALPTPTVTIAGPEKLAVSTSGSYNVKIYGPVNLTWRFYVNLSGPQKGSASMTSPEGKAGNNSYEMVEQAALSSPEFNFTLNAPSAAGPLQMKITALASDGSTGEGVARWTVDVRAKRDVTLNATIRNSGETPVGNLKVAYYVRQDGQWKDIGNTTVGNIDGRGKANASFIWDSTLFDNGVYTIRVVADPDHENPQYTGAENTYDFKVQLRTPGSAPPKPIGPGVYVLAGIIIAGAAAGVYYWRKKKII